VQLLTPELDLDAFFDHVRHADCRALLLDYDGTLAPFCVDRAKAVPYPAVSAMLPALLRLPNCRTVIVSGRAVADLAELIGVQPLPEMWGSHGWEHLSGEGAYTLAPLDEASVVALRQAGQILDALHLPNLREDKPVSVAAHWRGLPFAEAGSVRQYVQHAWTGLLASAHLQLNPFDGGLELRATGRDKGSVVTEILAELTGDVTAAFLGDDLTDEDAFQALGGKGLRVLVRSKLRETLADLWLQPPDELIDFLARWKEACSATGNAGAANYNQR
jgi:trehalose 6-phosphate phosphatase